MITINQITLRSATVDISMSKLILLRTSIENIRRLLNRNICVQKVKIVIFRRGRIVTRGEIYMAVNCTKRIKTLSCNDRH